MILFMLIAAVVSVIFGAYSVLEDATLGDVGEWLEENSGHLR